MMPQETDIEKPHHFVFRSKLPDIHIPNLTPLFDYVFDKYTGDVTGELIAGKPCLINGSTGRTLTYADVYVTSRRMAAGFHKIGVGKGDVVMILLPNSPEFALSFLAAAYMGAVATTANPLYTAAEISKQGKASGTKVIVTTLSYAGKVKDLQKDGVVVVCVDDSTGEHNFDSSKFVSFTELTKTEETEYQRPEISPEDTVALPYSSGTTGLPKGVMITQKGMVTSIGQKVDGENPNLNYEVGDVIICFLPMFHIYALDALMLSGIRAGATILIVPRFEISLVLQLIQRYKVTVLPVAPPVVLAMIKSPELEKYEMKWVRIIMCGAAAVKKDLEDAVRLMFPNAIFGQGYGMTEAGTLTKSLAFAKTPYVAKSGACGTVVRNAQLKIIDPTTGASLPRNRPGEICIRGDQLMKGYLNDPKATAETIDEEGWLHTGDVGYVDDDDELFIVDRLKELIKYKGYQVAPAELESLLISHPQIEDAAVVGMKDEVADEVPVAFVVRSQGSQLKDDDVKDYIHKQVVHYKRIRVVFFIEAIPKSASGKILRKELRAKLEMEYPK